MKKILVLVIIILSACFHTGCKLFNDEEDVDDEFSLDGVSYIKLVFSGTLGREKKQGIKIIY